MFGCIVAGRAVQTNLQTLTPTQFTFSIPSPGSINHLVIFLLPDTILPPTHAATVHIRFPSQPTFQLLGAISAAKPSAIFRVRGIVDGAAMMDQSGDVTLGISVEPVEAVERGVGTLQLAQRIIGNAFNYLSSFSQSAGGEEVVPLKAFQEWWKKFEKKVEYDPSFLEREGE
ncbi:hypothetical protein BDD12DRAFT_915045 [Trichophaea hybrida]|nr:hypothetical protein BDD12DRAFT_915045 [Trichophaea hybrida]